MWLLAFEAGFRACEKGINLEKAKRQFIDELTSEPKPKKER